MSERMAGTRQPDPKQAVGARQAKSAGMGSFEDTELVPQADDLKLQDRARADAISKRHQERDEDGHRSEG
jgi:hypothetical protein